MFNYMSDLVSDDEPPASLCFEGCFDELSFEEQLMVLAIPLRPRTVIPEDEIPY